MEAAEAEFERELSAFDRDVQLFAQYFYSYQAIHYLASQEPGLLKTMNWHALYWNTNLGALQEASFSTLGRIFDHDDRSHSIHRLLRLAREHDEIFSTSAIRTRKVAGSANADDWIDDFVARCYTPSSQDWNRLGKHLDRWSSVFTANYRPLRHKVYAHRDRLDAAQLEALFSATSYVELERLAAFLDAFNRAIWELYHNGRRPVLRTRRYSLVAMIQRPRHTSLSVTVGERIALETRAVLREYRAGRRAAV